jgi:glucose-6-phosphate isomerase
MLPAILCGINSEEILEGGRKVLNNFEHSIEKIENGARFVADQFFERFSQHVSFIYTDKLLCFGSWLAQLYGESTGKSGKGITPLTAIGSVDQHSQLQLYLDGKRDKCFTFFLEKQKSELKISNEFMPKNFAYLGGKRVSDIFEAQCAATATSILEKGCRLRKIEIPEITPEILGALFMHFMLEVVCVCRLIGVNPFDQPAVERGKTITQETLKKQT